MKEYINELGGRPWYGSELADLEAQPLEAIQTFFKRYGTCVLQGCAITANGGNWDIAAGLVAINHADGFKVAKFAGATNIALPGYLSIDKDVEQALYESTSNEDAVYDYTAVFTAGAPSAGDDTELIIPSPSGGTKPLSFDDMIARYSIEEVAHTTSTGSVISASDMYAYHNRATAQLYIKGTATITNWGSLTGSDSIIAFFGTNFIPVRARPASKKYFHAYVQDPGTNAFYYKDINNTDYMKDFICTLDTNGTLNLRFIKPSSSFAGTTITVVFDAVINLK